MVLQVVDATGAGDISGAAPLTGRLGGADPQRSVGYGGAGSPAMSPIGARTGRPSMDAVERLPNGATDAR